MKKEKSIPIHLAKYCVFAGVITWCRAGMQHGFDGWRNSINYWGTHGIRKYKPIELLAFDPRHATCKKCLRAVIDSKKD